LYTFGKAHLIEYDQIPDAEELDDDEIPIGALILAHQAVGISSSSKPTVDSFE